MNKKNSEMRSFSVVRNFTKNCSGSVLVSYGDTKVICTASIENRVPFFLKDGGRGWLTAEYSLLPSATKPRAKREVSKGKPSGRTCEIQRLIGRALRTVIDFEALGERTINIDADVIQADGGTRTASITGGMIALWDAMQSLIDKGELKVNPIKQLIAAVSVGVVDGQVICDLCYEEDSNADVDMNVVMTESGEFVEVQGTGEEATFTREQLDKMLGVAEKSIHSIINRIKELIN
jgi:ribonuclease PH